MSDYIKQLEDDNAKLREKLEAVTKELDETKAENASLKMYAGKMYTNKVADGLVSVQPILTPKAFSDIMKAFSNSKGK
jgi:hypothetical protein